MSSPSHHRQRSSRNTPGRSSQRSSQLPSSHPDPAAAQLQNEAAGSQAYGTPRRALAFSSPMNFRSSPADLARENRDVSSPLRQMTNTQSTEDGQRTPRASRNGAIGDSSPIRYEPSSSPNRNRRTDPIPSDSSGLFVRSSRSLGPGSAINNSRRGDINSENLNTPHARRRIFMDESGRVVREIPPEDSEGPSFSNIDPTTSDAQAMGGNSTMCIWGTNVSINDTLSVFKEFLRNYTKKYRMWGEGMSEEETQADEDSNTKEYMQMMENMLTLGITSLNLDFRNLKAYPPTKKLWQQAQDYPQDIVTLMDQGIKDVMYELAEAEMTKQRQSQSSAGQATQRSRALSSEPGIPSSDRSEPDVQPQRGEESNEVDLCQEVQKRSYRVRPFGLDSTINMRDLNPSDVDKIVAIKGLVIRTTPIIPDMKDAFFRCQICNHTVKVDIDRGKIAEPTECPRPVCKTANSMQIVHNRSGFMDKQVIKLQETPDSVPAGQTPHSVSMCAYDELVDLCKAGDRVEITGIFKASPVRVNPRQRTLKSIYKTYIDVLHIQKVDKKRMGIDVSTVEQDLSEQLAGNIEETRKITEEEEEKIKETAARPDIYELLSRSLAPSIFEMDDVKKGILLQLFGGTNKSFEKGGSPKYRGDINVLLCGDPSTAKSQLLQYVHKIAPRGVYTSGKGSSAVGLTAYVTRDPETRQLVLESGALVLSDGGVCCIDEFDKMSDATRSVLHEVMEQQTVSIAKAGIITTLNARTSILASANPIGSKYNPSLPVPQNIDLPPTLLSRFDLVYLILDRIDETSDRRLARHLLSMYLDDKPQSASGGMEILPIEFLTSYVSYARTKCQPKISSEASKELVNSYVEMRKLGEDVRAAERRITATTRQLESMIRLSEAHAKMRLSEIVTRDDVIEAVRLIKSALKQAATDARTGLIDMSLLTEGTSASERRRRADLKNSVLSLLDDMTRQGQAARYSEVMRRMGEQSSIQVDGAEFAEAIRMLEQEGWWGALIDFTPSKLDTPTDFLPRLFPPPRYQPQQSQSHRYGEYSMLIVHDLNAKTLTWQKQTSGALGHYNFKPGVIIMKFGEQLRMSVISEYRWYYIAYDELKQQLKTEWVTRPSKENPRGQRKEWTEEDEGKFIGRMEQELDKVYSKQKLKADEIARRIANAEQEVNEVVKSMAQRGPAGSEGQNDGPTEEEFMLLEEDLSDIIADVHDLAKFVQLNYTGFQKIIKKHDKQTKWVLKPVFATRLKVKPFFEANYDANIVKLSKLYDVVRTRGNPVQGDSAAGGSQASFVRQTTKYWVHPDNVTELKLIILKHLPVLVYNASKEFDIQDSAITSIYYDNPDTWELYEGRLKKTEGAEAIRLRWYGGMQTEQIFVERKTHREDWTGEKSVKARFSMKEKNVNAYMKGEFLPAAIFEKDRRNPKKVQKTVDENERLAREIQYSVLKKGYKPVCRSFYNRTAFQLPADARVRISLDTELTMVREDNLDGKQRSGDNWRRMDIGIDWPFKQLPPEDVERFPYAVLEVKLQTQHGQEPPEWVRELIASHLVEAVPKFSKFIHGTATLFPDRINLLPFWMPQMDTDIRKPVTQHVGIHRPGYSANTSTSDDDDDDDDSDDENYIYPDAAPVNGSDENIERLRQARETLEDRDLDNRAAGNNLDIEEQIAAMPLNEAYPLYDSDDEDDENDALGEARRIGGWTHYSKLLKKYARIGGQRLSHTLKNMVRPSTIPANGVVAPLDPAHVENKKFKAPNGKKIHVPVRVEPKVYFAAERTFLSWLEFSIYIGTIAATLLNFGSKPTALSFVAAGAFNVVAIIALAYSVGIYLWRSKCIRERRAIKYHDKWGPSVLCAALFLAILMNAGFEGRAKGVL